MQTAFDQRGNNFDSIRMMLAVLVIFSHSYPLGTGSEVREPFVVVTHGQVTGGHFAVDLFFIISGFLITASFERSKSIWSYLKKRICRIYPGFIVVMLLCALFVLPASGGHMSAPTATLRAFDFIKQTAQLREFTYTGAFAGNPLPDTLNGSMWSIPYEFWCYIGVIVLGMTGMLRSSRGLLALFACSLLVSLVFAVFNLKISGSILGKIFGYPPFWARLLPMYLAGVVFYKLRHKLSLKISWIASGCAALVLAAILPYGWSLIFPVAGAYLVLVLAFHPALRLHNWNRYGDFSYGTYLYAFPIQQMIMRWVGHPIPAWKLFLMAAPITIGFAILSWHGIEKWFLRVAHPTVSRGVDKMLETSVPQQKEASH